MVVVKKPRENRQQMLFVCTLCLEKSVYSILNKYWPIFTILSLLAIPWKFAIKGSLNTPPHLKRVTTLLCENKILISEIWRVLCAVAVCLKDKLARILMSCRQQPHF